MKIRFLGAARQVTGSMYQIILSDGYTILLDCGLDYEQSDSDKTGQGLPFNPADIDLVIITHAHIDHTGMLPVLPLLGFQGHILCTPPTGELVKHLLFDSCHLQWAEYRKQLGKTRKSRQSRIPRPMYGLRDVDACMEHISTLPFNTPLEIRPGVSITFLEVGHILGAASVKLEIIENGKLKTIGFTGDLGRKGSKLLKDPQSLAPVDFLISEATYGGRKHKVSRSPDDELFHYIYETCIRISGRLVIPAFSVGRTQAILFTIHQLKAQGKIPASLKVYADSPLAFKSTHVYEKYSELLNQEATEFSKQHSLFSFEGLEQLDPDESDVLSVMREACIIVSSAGMVEGGRIQQHVANHIGNPFSTILIAGFCAPHTLGFRLLQGLKQITIKHKLHTIHAQIAQTDVFSAHPDSDEIFEYIQSCIQAGCQKVFLTHGEWPMLQAMQDKLIQSGFDAVEIPEAGAVADTLNISVGQKC